MTRGDPTVGLGQSCGVDANALLDFYPLTVGGISIAIRSQEIIAIYDERHEGDVTVSLPKNPPRPLAVQRDEHDRIAGLVPAPIGARVQADAGRNATHPALTGLTVKPPMTAAGKGVSRMRSGHDTAHTGCR